MYTQCVRMSTQYTHTDTRVYIYTYKYHNISITYIYIYWYTYTDIAYWWGGFQSHRSILQVHAIFQTVRALLWASMLLFLINYMCLGAEELSGNHSGKLWKIWVYRGNVYGKTIAKWWFDGGLNLLVNCLITTERCIIFHGKSHHKWPRSKLPSGVIKHGWLENIRWK